MSVHEHIKALPPAGIGNLLPKENLHNGLGFRDCNSLGDVSVRAVGAGANARPSCNPRSEFVCPFG